jgi:acetolactate synthase-1/2/3 large subunit
MNGAEALVRTLVGAGVDVCFANPGTSEMHFVAALDRVPEMRAVLCLFEGVATGAADGYGRMAGHPACTLLHLGAGLGNGIANLHNARRAGSPIVNIVGDHATDHVGFDTPLTSDIDALAKNISSWRRTSTGVETVSADAVAAVAAALGPPGQVATLVLPADVCWLEGAQPALAAPPTAPALPVDRIEPVAARLTAADPGTTTILLGGRALSADAQRAAAAIAESCGARLLAEVFPARQRRGAGLPVMERLACRGEAAAAQLAGTEHLVLAGAAEPFTFFAYPGHSSRIAPVDCEVHSLARAEDDVPGVLAALGDALGARPFESPEPLPRPERPSGEIDPRSLAAVIGAVLPEEAIVSDEGNTAGFFLPAATASAPAHDWLCLAGGAIGQGLPVATGAAVACPDRKVLSIEADGSAMYTPQALWTQAREGLDVTTVILNNGSYAVLNLELDRVGADGSGMAARELLDLGRPDLDFVSLARGMGVPASRAHSAEELASQLETALATPGPVVVEAMLASRGQSRS